MTAPRSTTSPPNTPRRIDLNVIQVTAAALAAVTAAVIGSRLGIAGTLVGAAGASVTLTVGTAVYRASLERSRETLRALATRRARPSPRQTESTDTTDREPQPADRSRLWARMRWGVVTVVALAGFVLAMMVITGLEWARGETLGGHGTGTTIGQVVDAPSGPQGPAVPPAPHSSSVPPSKSITRAPSTSETTTTPDGGSGVTPRPSTTSGPPATSEVSPTPSLIPPGFPGFEE